MESKKINQLATAVSPSTSDLAIIGDPVTGVSKKITWLQVSTLIGTAANLQQVTDNGATTTNPVTIGGLTITGLSTGVLKSDSGVISSVPFGAANGVATLAGDGKVPSSQLPSYVDDVVEVANYAALPVTGETGKIYITLDNNKVYRWGGSVYVEIAANNAIWGSITGTLANQTDLQNALNLKANDSLVVHLAGTETITGTKTFSNPSKNDGGILLQNGSSYSLSGYMNLGGMTDGLRFTSGGGISNFFTLPSSVGYTYTFPALSGTIVAISGGNSTQYIDGTGALQTFPTLLSSDNLVKLVRNQSGATMTAGTIVYISGATGNKPLITKAIATSDATSAQTFGLVQANIANNADGYVVIIGNIGDLDTSALTEGQQLYLSGTTAGAYTTTKPYAPIHLVYVGIVLRSHPTQGIIGVKIQNGYEMDELHNVDAQSPSNNDILSYNTSTSLWEHKQIATTLGFTPISLSSLSATSPLSYNNGTGAFSIQVATASQNGYLSSTDFSTFNNKQAALGGTGFVKITGSTISYDNSTYYLASNPSGYITLASLSAGAGISYSNITGVISSTITQYTDALARAAISSSATGLTYTSATGVFSLTAGYAIPTTAKQTEWDTAYTNRITSLTTTGSSGAATLVSNTLNVPTYTLSGLGGQPLDADLTAIAGLTGTSGFLKKNAADTWSLDTNTYVTTTTAQTISGAKTFSASPIIDGGFSTAIPLRFKQYDSASFNSDGYTDLYVMNAYRFGFAFNQGSSNYKGFTFNVNGITLNTSREYTMPNASGTIALTSDIPSLAGYLPLTGGVLTNTGGNGTPILRFDGSSTASFQWMTSGFNSSMDTGNTILHFLGKSGSSKNAGYFGFQWNADQSDSNFISLGFFNYDHLFKLYANGNANLSGSFSAASASLTSYVDISHTGTAIPFKVNSSSGYGFYNSSESTLNFNYGHNATSTGYINYDGYQAGITQFRNLIIADGKRATIATFQGSSKNLTIIGAISASNLSGTNTGDQDLSGYVTLATNQTISAIKKYTDYQQFDNGIKFKSDGLGMSLVSGYVSVSFNATATNHFLALASSVTSPVYYTYEFPNAAGTLALTSDIPTLAGLGGVPTSRTLTINGTGYDLSANRSWTINTSQWTTSGSNIYYNSTGYVGIGIDPAVKFHIVSNGATYSSPAVNDVATIYVKNTNSASTSAHAILSLRTTASTGGNPFISWDLDGVLGYAMGIDNADSDKFKLNFGWNTLNSNTFLEFTTAGKATFSYGMQVNGIYYVPNTSYFVSGTSGYRFNSSGDAYNNFIMYDNGTFWSRAGGTINGDSVIFGTLGIGVTPTQSAKLTFADALGQKILFNNNANNYRIDLVAAISGGDAMMKFIAGSTSGGEIGFYTSPTQMNMFINSSGSLLLGTTTDFGKITCAGNIASYTASGFVGAYSTNPANDAIVYAGWTSGNGMTMAYNPNSAIGYISNLYPAEVGQMYGDIHFRRKASSSFSTTMLLKAYSQNVIIGDTGDMGSRLQITGANTNATPIVNIYASGNGQWQRGIRLQNSGMSAGSSLMISTGYADSSYNQGQFYFYFAGAGSTSNRISMGLHSVDDVFNIMGTGNILVNTTSENSFGSAKSIQLNGAGGSLLETRYNGTSGLRIGSGSDHSYHHDPRNAEMRFATSDSTRFYIYGNGNYSFTGSNVSDRRAKDNISLLDITATDKIMSLEAKSYNMKNNPSQKRYGFIAQEVKQIVSDLVSGNENDGYLGLDYDGLLTLTIKALQEQQKEIQILKQK